MTLSYAPDLIYTQQLEAEYQEAAAASDGSVLQDAIAELEAATHSEVIDYLCEHFEVFCEACLMVADFQSGDMIPLRLKPTQRLIARRIMKRWAEGRPVRLIILKSRRQGVSTLIQAFIFWMCWSMMNRVATTVAHDTTTTAKIFAMTETFYREMDPDLRPQRDRAKTGHSMRFGNSSRNMADQDAMPGLNSEMTTVSLENAGTGSGAQALHLSEVAKYKGDVGRRAMKAVLQIVPAAARTIVVWESTAEGMDEHFEPAWTKAEEGEGDYEPIFIPWYWEPTYRMAVPDDFEPTEEEQRLIDRYSLDLEQIVWYRWCFENQCKFDLDTLHQEFPAEPREAFLSTGRPYFNRVKVDAHRQLAQHVTPFRVGQVATYTHPETGKSRVRLVDAKRGRVKVWEPPRAELDYIIACDPSEGSGHDPQAAYVLARDEPLRFVAAWHGRIDRFDLGDELYLLGCLYNVALIAVEITGGWGAVPIGRLRSKGYPRIHKKIVEDKGSRTRTEKWGWETTPFTRDLPLSALAEAVHSDVLEPYDEHLYREMLKFIYNENTGKPEAEGGAHDDRIMAAGIALHLHTILPRVNRNDFGEVQWGETADPVTGYG